MKYKHPGDMFNTYQKKKKKKHGLRSADVVVRDEQKSSHQFYKKRKVKRKGNPNSPENYGRAMKGAYESKYGKVPTSPAAKPPKFDFTKGISTKVAHSTSMK